MSSTNNNDDDNSDNNTGGGGKRKRDGGNKGNNYDIDVQADDSFRNYMVRKIDLQRQQFGLVLPPPPPSPSPQQLNDTPPQTILKKKRTTQLAKTKDNDRRSRGGVDSSDSHANAQINKTVAAVAAASKTDTNNNNTAAAAQPEKKSVRFDKHLEVEGVSQILLNLQKKHGTKRRRANRMKSSSYKRRRSSSSSSKSSRTFVNNTNGGDDHPNNDVASSTSSVGVGEEDDDANYDYCEPKSVLGVLDNLQKKYGMSRRRSSSSSFSNNSSLSLLSMQQRTTMNPFASTTTSQSPPPKDNDQSYNNGEKNDQQTISVLESSLGSSVEEAAGFLGSSPSTIDDQSVTAAGGGGGSHFLSSSATTTGILRKESNYAAAAAPSGGSTTAPMKRRKESPRCKGQSVLEGLELEQSLLHQESQTALSHKQNEEYGLKALVEDDTTATSSSTQQKQPSSCTIQTAKSNHRPDLFFMGVVVLVNGHTSPDATTLMRLLHKHGGDLEKYETQRITHIIAEQLSVAKANIYKRQKKPTPICRPEWITDSVEQGKLLPFGDYLLEDVVDRNVVGTKSVKSFFSTKKKPVDGDMHRSKDDLNHTKKSSPGDKHLASVKKKSATTNESENSSSSLYHRWQDTHPSAANYSLTDQVRTVGNDPNFLDSYFSNSRLSYIGSFKQRVKKKKATTKIGGCRDDSPRLKVKVGTARKFVLLVDMDCFFASVVLRKYPQYRDKPVAVGHCHVARQQQQPSEIASKSSQTNSSSELSTCNYIARKSGVRKGMFLGDAIVQCPDLVVLPYDFDGYEEVSSIVVEQLQCYAEQYNGCVEVVSCDESYVELNIAPDDGRSDVDEFVKTLAERIRADIFKKTECTASIGIGVNKVCCF